VTSNRLGEAMAKEFGDLSDYARARTSRPEKQLSATGGQPG